MKIHAILLSSLIAMPTTVFAQQTNTYQVCRQYKESYIPGYYNNQGNYVQGGIQTLELTVNCQTGQVYSSKVYNGSINNNYIAQPPVNYAPQRTCNPAAGALLGAGLASAITGNRYNYGGRYYRNYSRYGYNGGWNSYGSNQYGWSLFGAGLGALMFSC